MNADLQQDLQKRGFLATTLDNTPQSEVVWEAHGSRFQWQAAGILQIRPLQDRSPGSAGLVLSAGVHGDETAPIELLDGLVRRLVAGELRPACPILLILGNPEGMRQHKRFIGSNLNRLFTNSLADAGTEADRARQLMQSVRNVARHCTRMIHFDMHTAIRASLIEKFAICPSADRPVIQQEAVALLGRCGIEAAIMQNRPGKTFSNWTHLEFGAVSFTMELGRVAPLGQNDLRRLDALRIEIEALFGCDPWERFEALGKHAGPQPRLFAAAREVMKTGPGFELCVADNLPNFSEFHRGDLLWKDESNGHQWQIDEDRLYLLFPNNQVATGQRAALLAREL